jgi:hypothetical protein
MAEVAGAAQATRYESLVRLTGAIRSRTEDDDLFGLLVDETATDGAVRRDRAVRRHVHQDQRLWVSAFANGSPRVAAAKSISLDVFKIGQPQGPARS